METGRTTYVPLGHHDLTFAWNLQREEADIESAAPQTRAASRKVAGVAILAAALFGVAAVLAIGRGGRASRPQNHSQTGVVGLLSERHGAEKYLGAPMALPSGSGGASAVHAEEPRAYPTQFPLGSAIKVVAPLRSAMGEELGKAAAGSSEASAAATQDARISSEESASPKTPGAEPEAAPKAPGAEPEPAAADEGSAVPREPVATLPPAPAATPPPAIGWGQEHIGFFKSTNTGQCLSVEPGNGSATLTDCDWTSPMGGQSWVVDVATGFIRSLIGGGTCLDVDGTPGWKDGAVIGAAKCGYEEDPDSTDQRWKFDRGGYVVNRLSGKCLAARPENELAIAGAELRPCNFSQSAGLQAWAFVSLTQVATEIGAKAGRPNASLTEEEYRRHQVKALTSEKLGHTLLVFDDVVRAADPAVLLGGSFFQELRRIFADMSPKWNGWEDVMQLGQRLAIAGPEQSALGNAIMTNMISNLLFASSNFVQGFAEPNVSIMGMTHIDTKRFHMVDESIRGCSTEYGYQFMAFCFWPEPVKDEKMGIVNFQELLSTQYNARLPGHTFFETIFTGSKVPSWEDADGMQLAFQFLSAGAKAAQDHGEMPIMMLRGQKEPRLAYDTEGVQAFLGTGFGYFRPQDIQYASQGSRGAPIVEKLMDKYKDHKDVLGILMTDSPLSMHLKYDKEKKLFVLDLTDWSTCTPLPGYAPLGGRAIFQEKDGRLVTVQLEYASETYADFDDNTAEKSYLQRSSLRGWRYAEKALIATLMAKTQLLTHVKLIHLELAPALQAVTVDAFADVPEHPMRRLLEPFISRSVQASQTNLQLWFEFRLGEFGLAPMPMEEQLKLVHSMMENQPLDLADLDMERYAHARDMEEFTGDNVQEGRWVWKWHQRALSVQREMAKLVECWLEKYTQGNDNTILKDKQVDAWWGSLMQHIPALGLARAMNKDYIESVAAPTEPDRGSSEEAPASEPAEHSAEQQQAEESAEAQPAEEAAEPQLAPQPAPQPAPPPAPAPAPAEMPFFVPAAGESTPSWQAPAPAPAHEASEIESPHQAPAHEPSEIESPHQAPAHEASEMESPHQAPEPAPAHETTTVNIYQPQGSDVAIGFGKIWDNFQNLMPQKETPHGAAPETPHAPALAVPHVAPPAAAAPETPAQQAEQVEWRPVETTQSPEDNGFKSLLDLHPNEPSTGLVKDKGQVPMVHRRRLQESGTPDIAGLSHASLRHVLSTLFVWVSWIHEDVGHASASLVYDPVHTPMFVPEDGVGIPAAALSTVTAAYRDFVYLERPKLLDEPPHSWFDKKRCKKVLLFNECKEPIDDKKCYTDFQAALKQLGSSHPAFQECDGNGFFSCVDRVETSASS